MRIIDTLRILIAIAAIPLVANTLRAASSTQPASPIAVVELFLSEGCSSCPPAEQNLAALAKRAEEQHLPVFALAFHVDYWNDLGWRDSFSDAAYSERQKQYVAVMNLNSAYTPQMIVNGTTQFVGSDQAATDRAINAALATPASATIRALLSSDRQLDMTLDPSAGTVLNIAAVDRQATTKVARGENAGRTLTESNIVRWFKSIAPDAAGHAAVQLPADVHGSSVMVYAQRSSDWAIVGASCVELR